MVNFKKIKKVLVVRTDRIGDVLLNLPAIELLKKKIPQAQFTLMTGSNLTDLLQHQPVFNEVINYDLYKDKTLKLWLFLLKRRFDLCLIMNPQKKFHALSFLSGIPYRCGYDRKWGRLLNFRREDVKAYGEKHEIEYNLDLLSELGINYSSASVHFNLSTNPSHERKIKKLFLELFKNETPSFIAIHPFASVPYKEWPYERYAELIKKIKEIYSDLQIIFVGQNNLQQNIWLPSQTVNLINKLDLNELAALLKKARLLISTDSGPLHIAAGVGTRTIALFGPNFSYSSPTRWGPWGENHIVIHKKYNCSPCKDTPCMQDFSCMKSIDINDVFQAFKKQMLS